MTSRRAFANIRPGPSAITALVLRSASGGEIVLGTTES